MFRRGQKIRIIESNAKKRTHPAIGDVGYLNNMFFFPKDRFILINLFMCSYGENDHRSERKNFILDMGMHDSTKNKISRTGVNKLFFMKKPSVNLNPTFFLKRRCRYAKKAYEILQAFPQLVGTYGIWTSYTSISTKHDRNNDSLFRIPCGNIARCSEKRNRSQVDMREFAAWLRSISTEIIPSLQLLNEFYPSNGGKLNNYAMCFWEDISFMFNSEMQYDHVRYLRFKEKEFYNITPTTRLSVINSVLKLRNLTYMACERLTRHLINGRTSKGRMLQRLKTHLSVGHADDLIDPDFACSNELQVTDAVFITEYLYRTLMVESDTISKLRYITKYLPLDKWDIDQMAIGADKIKSNADSNSAALNRIFDLIKPQSVSDWFSTPSLKTTSVDRKPGMQVSITSNKLDRLGIKASLTNEKIDMGRMRTAGREMQFEMKVNETEQQAMKKYAEAARRYNSDDGEEVMEQVIENLHYDDYDEEEVEEDEEWDEDPEEANDDF